MIAGLSIRPAGAPAPIRVDSIRLIAGSGAEGDRHLDPLSPRQLLLASCASYADLLLPPQALRENLLFDDDIDRLPSGTVLQIGDEAKVRLMFACEACGRLDLHGERLAARIGARRGVLARVVEGGVIRPGDPVRDLGQGFASWPEDWRLRIAQVLDAVPAGAVVDYAQLARLAGIQSSYCRAFPRLLRGLGATYAHKAVAARTLTSQPRWTGAGLFDQDPLPPSRPGSPR
ncbi:MOSC domain-containing protein [Massilia aurea]|uniref:MOSC domain-containing protein n=1 Tax=Massilia aurea TaxID=373040 RepID=UPI001E3193EB|nr:MOSC domain-containing protein [Massilia aurea]